VLYPNPRPDLDRQERKLDALLEKVELGSSDTDLTPEKRRARREEADASALAFANIYFPEVFTAPWSDLHRHMAGLEEGRYSISGFPKSGKSAFAFLGKLLRHIALGRGGVACVAARTDDKARAHADMLHRIIERAEVLRYDYALETIQDRSGDRIYKAEGGQTRLVSASVNTGVRGTVSDTFDRIAIAVGDDLYDRESARSDVDNERVYKWITGELYRQLDTGALALVLGNAIVEGCPILQLKEAFPESHFSFPITDEDGTPNWPAVHTKEDVEELRRDTDHEVWEGEYMERPAQKGDVFEEEWLRTVNIAVERILASVTAVDPAHGESPHACYKAAFSAGITQNREVVGLDVWLRKRPYAELFDHLAALGPQLPAHKAVLFENDFSQWSFAKPYYERWCAERGQTLPIVMHRASNLAGPGESADKEARILKLVHPHHFGQFLYHTRMTDGPDWKRYRGQLLAFGEKSENLDGLDAAATAYVMVSRYLSRGTFESTADRARQRPSWGGGFH
jgi:hypothetical protein